MKSIDFPHESGSTGAGCRTPSLSETKQDEAPRGRKASPLAVIKQFLRYCGPGYMIAVGYMDPGNWATDIEAGSRFGYSLLFIILLSNFMAMVLQHLCVRLGVSTRMDLARACRERMPRWANLPMYLIAEIAIISCDLAEVIGTAIALKLLFNMPIMWGVLLTVADVLLLLAGLGGSSEARSYRILEGLVIVLMSIIGLCFLVEMFLVKPDWPAVLYGFLPFSASRLMLQEKALYSALGIIGATVMPHNLYLHSSIVQHRLDQHNEDVEAIQEKTDKCEQSLSSIINYSTADSTIALFLALFINAAILITGAAAFHSRGQHDVDHIEDASKLMRDWLGPASAILFGLALLAAGQSSTVTGTMAGQIVFEGHLQMRMRPWIRRLVTRLVAIAPAILIIWIAGADSINEMLIYSQIVLSFQLPFAIIPLIIFAFRPLPGQMDASEKVRQYWMERRMSRWERPLFYSSILIALVLVGLNLMFLVKVFM